MKLKAKAFYFDLLLKKHINADEVFEATEERANYLMEKGLVTIVEDKTEDLKPKTRKAVKRKKNG